MGRWSIVAAITWAISGGRVVELVDGTMRLTDISVDAYNRGDLPYGRITGEPFTLVPHQTSPTNFDVSSPVVPWIEDLYRGVPDLGDGIGGAGSKGPAGSLAVPIGDDPYGPEAPPPWWLANIPKPTPQVPFTPIANAPPNEPPTSTPTGVGLNTQTGSPKPFAVIGPPEVFIGGVIGDIRFVGPGPIVGEMSGIRLGTLPRIVYGVNRG